jgi:hypothetical protein
VDPATEIAEFLTTRRAKVTPEQAGLPTHGRRRVPGLRREEVASLARAAGRVGLSSSRRRRPVQQRVRPAVQRILDSIDTPALARNERLDHVAANDLGRALYAPMFESSEQPPNSARWTFLDPAAVDFYPDWERVAKDLVAHLRSQAGSNAFDRGLSDLVGELSTRSPEFRTWWAAHNVRFHQTGVKRIHHPIVGELELTYETMELSADAGIVIAVFDAEPASRSKEALNLLASWTATPQAADDVRN